MDGYQEYSQDGAQQQTSQCEDGVQIAPKEDCNQQLPIDSSQDGVCDQDGKDLGDICQGDISQDCVDTDQSQCTEQQTKVRKKHRHKKVRSKEREYAQFFGVNICGNKDKNDTSAYYDIDSAAVLEYQQYNNSSFRFTDVMRGKILENVIIDGLNARGSSSEKIKNGEFHAVNLNGTSLMNVTIRNMKLVKDLFMDKGTLLQGVTFESNESVCDIGFKGVKMRDVLFQDNGSTCNIRLLGAKIWNGVEYEKVNMFNLEDMKIRLGLK